MNKTVERLDAATENLPQVLRVLTAVGGIVANSQLLIAASVFCIGIWKASGRISGYLIAAGGQSYRLLY